MPNKHNGSIRNIHDAIDAKIDRAVVEIKARRYKREKQIEEEVHFKLGITKLESEWKSISGRDLQTGYYDAGSRLALAMAEAREELNVFDEELLKLAQASEDCHIAVVTGEYKEALTQLDTQIALVVKRGKGLR